MIRILTLTASVLLTACMQPNGERPDSTPSPSAAGTDQVVGIIRVVGSAPVNVRVVIDPGAGARDVEITGALVEELQRLSGAEVAVTGQLGGGAMPPSTQAIRATGYEILSVDGEPVITGTVEGTTSNWVMLRTTEGELVYLAGSTGHFRAGQKVWVQGPRSVIVQSYGTIRP